MKNEHEDPGSFGETTTPASGKSFLKRQYMGYSLPVWAGCVLIILAAVWYKFLRTPSEPPCRCRLRGHTARSRKLGRAHAHDGDRERKHYVRTSCRPTGRHAAACP